MIKYRHLQRHEPAIGLTPPLAAESFNLLIYKTNIA
jgi:hypothetical protein